MKLSILFFFLVLSFFENSHSISKTINSIFSFGDSLADTGNLIIIDAFTRSFAGKFPYGITFGHPTGRVSDGRLVIDFIAERLGLPLIPPFFSANQSFEKGVNFAVSGGTALDRSFFEQRGLKSTNLNISLGYQLGWFEELKPSLCKANSESEGCFNESLFVVGEFGVNDYTIQLTAGRSLEEVKLSVPMVIQAVSTAIEMLIEQGATRLLVAGIHPIGCLPLFLSTEVSDKEDDYDPSTGCLKNLNNLAKYHNRLLRTALSQLETKYYKTRIDYADYYSTIIQLAQSPRQFGFSDGALKACCGKQGMPYNFNMTAPCGQPGSEVCKDPSTYVNWDGIHFTEATYHQVATRLFLDGGLLPQLD